MLILAVTPLSVGELQKIVDILRESKCPNESLHNTFDNFTDIVDYQIVFDNALARRASEHIIIYKL